MKITPKQFNELIECDDFICENQGQIFTLAMDMNFDDDDFVEKYMNSRFCNMEMDSLYSYFQMADPEDSMDYITKEIQPTQNTQHYDKATMEWIGYMYRYLHIRLGISSNVIYKTLSLKNMLALYVGMHTQDDEYFLDVIKDKFKELR